jgi:prophage antirepressor-like protein
MDEKQLLITQFQHFNIEIYGTHEEPLFKASDIGNLLGIKKIRTTLENFDEECKVLMGAHSMGGLQEQLFLTEDGLYELLFISRKPIAKEFKKWVRHIIKDIRLNSNKQLYENNQHLQKQLEYYKEKTFEQTEWTKFEGFYV